MSSVEFSVAGGIGGISQEIDRKYPFTVNDASRTWLWSIALQSPEICEAATTRTNIVSKDGIMIHTTVNEELIRPGRIFFTRMWSLWGPTVAKIFYTAAIQGFCVVIVKRHAVTNIASIPSEQSKASGTRRKRNRPLPQFNSPDVIVPDPESYTIRWAIVKGERQYVAVPRKELLRNGTGSQGGILGDGNVPLETTADGEIAGAFVYMTAREPVSAGFGTFNGNLTSMGWQACEILQQKHRATEDYERSRYQAANAPLYLQSGAEVAPAKSSLFVWHSLGPNGIQTQSQTSEQGADMLEMYKRSVNKLWASEHDSRDQCGEGPSYDRPIIPLPPGQTLMSLGMPVVDTAGYRAEMVAIQEEISRCFEIPIEFLRGGGGENVRAGVLAARDRLQTMIEAAQDHLAPFLEMVMKFYYGPGLVELMLEGTQNDRNLSSDQVEFDTSATEKHTTKTNTNTLSYDLHVEFNRRAQLDYDTWLKIFEQDMISGPSFSENVFRAYGISERYMKDNGKGPDRLKRKRERERKAQFASATAKRAKPNDEETLTDKKGLRQQEIEEEDMEEDEQGRAKPKGKGK